MASDTIYDLSLPILQDDDIEEEDKTERLEDLVRKETDLKDKALESAVLDILWRFRNRRTGSAAPPPAPRHTVTKRNSPAPWQASRSATPVASSPRSGAASPVPPPGLSNRPGLFRMRSSQHSPFTSPRASPRMAFSSPHLSHSNLVHIHDYSSKLPGKDSFGDYSSDGTDWLGNEDTASNASSGYGGDWGFGSEWMQPQMTDMSPYDMLRSILQGHKTDEEIEAILEANSYDLSAAILSCMSEQGFDTSQIAASAPEQDKTYLVGKSMGPGSRPTTPAGQGKSSIPCRYWLATGQCLRADCKFSHDLSHHICKYVHPPTQGSPRRELPFSCFVLCFAVKFHLTQELSRYWLAGNCIAGDSCAFSHDPSSLMSNLSVQDASPAMTPPLEYPPGFQIGDLGSFPSLQNQNQAGSSPNTKLSASHRHQSSDSLHAPSSSALSSRVGLAPEFIPSRPHSHSRPSSRHASPGRAPGSSRLSQDEPSEAFPSLGAIARGPKKHHGKRGHGHAHRADKEPGLGSGSGSLADVVRMSPNPTSSPRGGSSKGLRARPNYLDSRESSSAAAQAIPAPEHIPWLETGERANREYLKARGEAIRHGGARNKFLQRYVECFSFLN